MGIASGARRLALVVLDACRDNPLANSIERVNGTRGATRGLAPVEPVGSNLLVAYATKDGHVASDGTGAHSPYTTAILEALKVPGLEVQLLWRQVHDRVLSATGRAQEPFTYGALGAEALYLNPPGPTGVSGAPIVQSGSAYDPRAAELAVWQSAQSIGTANAYRDYLSRYPDGQFSTQAKLAVDKLSQPNSSDPQQQQQQLRARSLDVRECIQLAQRQTGYDPNFGRLRVQFNLGLSPRAAIVWGPDPHVPSVPASTWEQAQKYANALGACFQARGYTLEVRQCVQASPARCENW
jgi:hypothetical protein